MIFQVSELPLFHRLFPDQGNPVNLIASQLLVVYTAIFNDPLRSLCKEDSSHFWRVLALSMGQSALPVVLDKATSTSIKAFFQAIRRARIPATGSRATFLHHITPRTSTQESSEYYILHLQQRKVKSIPIPFLPLVIKERIHHL